MAETNSITLARIEQFVSNQRNLQAAPPLTAETVKCHPWFADLSATSRPTGTLDLLYQFTDAEPVPALAYIDPSLHHLWQSEMARSL